ncbi:MAG: hypothetical protein B6242_03750 [Anaerolineaceae bacterium 4572_78]|nr:MAG: hypothetical protein B6242_03750 [Anaerolineaceae bacterium 4572_78]
MTTQLKQESTLFDIAREVGTFRCLECGKCTAVCPISRYDSNFSPRRVVGQAFLGKNEDLLNSERMWSCLTCLHCSEVCPAGVAYSDLTLAIRAEAMNLGTLPACTHSQAIHTWVRMMMEPDIKQDRLGWLNDELKVSDDSDTLYFVGCAPYYGALFEPLGLDGAGIAQSTVKALNKLGIEPQVLADERCCGHDLLWEGDREGFETLAKLNKTLIHESGAKRIVTACPECAKALKVDYPAHGVKLDVEVLHLSELLADETWQGSSTNGSVTYHDPCRLGRHLGVYDAPRQTIEKSGLELVEMQRHKQNSLCCGTSGWSSCGVANKSIQVERLREARATGAETLITACIKCQIHLRCAMQDKQLGDDIAIEIKDMAVIAAEAMD